MGDKIMITGVHHTAISTGDLDRLLGFYRDLLGFQEVFSSAWEIGNERVDGVIGLKNTSGQVVMLKAGNAFIEFFQYATPTPKPADPNRPVVDHGITHICLEVEDIDYEYERLKNAGMLFHCPPTGSKEDQGLRATYGRDPDGNVIELVETGKSFKWKDF
jgi:glyoxylase I family protein